MAPPTRLRPHLNDLLQKNHELEHVVADLRHQLTQSSAKWADERKTLAVGCDALMASFAKFRARLDVHPSDWGDSEGEVEQNLRLDAGRQSEEAVDVDNGMIEVERDQGVSAEQDLHERYRALAVELRVKEEELEESRRKHEAAEEELHRVQQFLDTQSEHFRATVASANGDQSSPERTPDYPSTQLNPYTNDDNIVEKLDSANREIVRLKHLLQEWKKYGSEWKRDGQLARTRVSELQRREDELAAQLKAAEDSKTRSDTEIQRLAGSLADHTVAMEHQLAAHQQAVKRVADLEAMVTLLRARLLPEQLASVDSEQNQAQPRTQTQPRSPAQTHASPQLQTPAQTQPQDQPQTQTQSQDQPQAQTVPRPTASTQSLTPSSTNANKRSDLIVLKIPYRGFNKKPPMENNEPRNEQNVPASRQSPAHTSIRVSPAPQRSNPLQFNPNDFEICIHTCNALPCRNDSRSFLWPRRQPSLPRHVLSTKRHHRCKPDCPGYRFLNMPLADAMKEPRRVKCRPPTEDEVALAIEEANGTRRSERIGARDERPIGGEGSREPEERDDAGGGSMHDEDDHDEEEEWSSRMSAVSPGKRVRSRTTDGEESPRSRKLRSRLSLVEKP